MFINFLNLTLILASVLIFIKFFIKLNNSNIEKIIGFYLIFTNIVILILINNINKFANILDIIIILLIVKLALISLLLTKS